MFTARAISVSEEEDRWIAGVCDTAQRPQHYFQVQQSKDVEKPDLHFEFDHQAAGFYGGVRKVYLSRTQLLVSLEEPVAKSHQLLPEIVIALELDPDDWEALR